MLCDMFIHLSRFRLENPRCSSLWCVPLPVQTEYSNTSGNNKQQALNPLSETRFGVGQGRDKSSGLTFAVPLFRGSTGWSRGGGHQHLILGQGLRPLLALGGFNSLEFSGMFVAFVMCFGLVLGRGESGVTIHLLHLPAPSMSWHVGAGQREAGLQPHREQILAIVVIITARVWAQGLQNAFSYVNAQANRHCLPILPQRLFSCASLGKSLHLSEPQFPDS